MPESMSEIDAVSDAVKTLDDAIGQDLEALDPDDVNAEMSNAESSIRLHDQSPNQPIVNDYQVPWDRLESETTYAWEVFCHYRDAGLQRSLRKTAQHVRDSFDVWKDDGGTPGGDYQRISKVAKENRWPERIALFDKDQERIYQLARSEAIREMAQRHEKIIEQAISALTVPVNALALAIKENPDFVSELSKQHKNKLIELSTRVMRTIPDLMSAERLSRGMPTEIIGGVIEHQVVHSVDRDQIGEVLAILEQAGVLDVGGTDSDVGGFVDAEVVEVHSVPAEDND